ncbi:MAG: phage terminase large subunit family protein [Lentisphaeria bacterium]|nr:phage terminase large subunit family protein [Lentisphaeria bacterium]
MPLTPTNMRVVDVARLLNSTEQGFVLPQARLYRQFNRVGFRISAAENPRNINLLKYIAWMFDQKHSSQEEPRSTARTYEERKEAERQRNAAQSLAGRDIAPIPEVVNPERKTACERNFQLFCETYFPDTYALAWSADHIKAIERIETAVLRGGLFALAMPRGSGKSTLTETAALWAMLYGHREFVTLIGATESAALEMLDSIKTELEVNERLAEDFPEVCYPIAQLDGIANRCTGQICNGERTRITWTSNEIVLPTIAESKASGIIVRVAGITGRIRGMKYKRSDGRSVRPSLVIIDDPQTSESAGSLEQTKKRVRVLAGDILGLAGPGQKISGIMPCTIIRPGDMADIILNRNTHPDWNGEKTRMVDKFPINMKLWEEYAEIRADALREEGNFQRATDFYLANREAMDAGAVVSWEARYNHDEVSALQHAMNLKLQDEAAFQAEYQNDPLPEDTFDESLLSVDEICGKINGIVRGKVPLYCDKLTMFIDVQKALLFYTVIAWADDFTGAVIDYGAWPDQHRRQFSLADANPTIHSKFPKAGFEGGLYSALTKLTDDYLGREWEREDGALLKIEKALVDANWGQSTDIVYQFCRQSVHAGIIMPSHGRYVGASSKPMTEYRRQLGDKLGFNWMIPNVAGKRAIRHVIYDTNYWKSFIHARLGISLGDNGCLSLYGRIPGNHQLLAEHLTAEYRVRTEGRGRTVDEWKLKPQNSDNHWLDCVAGCAVCASILGAALPETLTKARVPKARIKLSDRSSSAERVLTSPTTAAPRGKMKLSDLRRQKNGQ